MSGTYPNFAINVNDADSDPTNELQALSLSGSTLSISNGNAVILPDGGINYDAGNGISISGNTISNTAPDRVVSLTGGGAAIVTGTYPNFTITSSDNVNDADSDPDNELQSLSISGNQLSISNGNSIQLPNVNNNTIWSTVDLEFITTV